MTTKTRTTDPKVITGFNSLNGIVLWGIEHNNKFILIENIENLNRSGRLFYKKDNKRKSVASFMKEVKGLETLRWLNHLVFKDINGKIRKFKTHMENNYDVNFT